MDPGLLRRYNEELAHLREVGSEFARAYPKIAGRLTMSGLEVADPYVERLLEGFAFLAARVQLHVDAEYPRFVQHLLEVVQPGFVLDGVRHAVDIPAGTTPSPLPALPDPPAWTSDESATETVRLIDLAWARSGDKGNLSNIGVVARRPQWLPLLWQALQPAVVEAWFRHLPAGHVTRYHLPGTDAMNLLIHDALDGGGPSSMRMDPLGKGMAQMLLDMPIAVPPSVAAEALRRAGRA